jgi:preprotein translocase subunit YajC
MKKKKPWLKRILIGILALVVILAGVYWYVATDKFSDTKDRKAAYTLNVLDLIHEFQQNGSVANKKYTDKIITVSGTVSEIEAADTTLNIKFIDKATGSYAIFAFQQQHAAEAKSVKVGDNVSIKGSCSGSIYSQILEATAITFKRAALNK